MARVPGVGLLNRTCKSWVERHEVQFLRGLPTIRNGCVAQAELEQASHKREVGGSTPPTATKSFFISHLRFAIWLFSNLPKIVGLNQRRAQSNKWQNEECPMTN